MVAALVMVLCLAITPVFANTAPGSADGGDVAAAQQALAQAQLQALQARNQVVEAAAQLDNSRAQLTEAQAQLTALQGKITSLDTEVTSDQAQVSQLDGEIQQDKQQLTAFLRASYESAGSETTIEYVVDAQSISDLVARVNEVSHVADAGNVLVDQINAEEQQEQRVLAATVAARSEAQAAEQQEATQEVIIANDEANDAELLAEDEVAAAEANGEATTAQNQYGRGPGQGRGHDLPTHRRPALHRGHGSHPPLGRERRDHRQLPGRDGPLRARRGLHAGGEDLRRQRALPGRPLDRGVRLGDQPHRSERQQPLRLRG